MEGQLSFIFTLHTFGLTAVCEGVHLRDGQDQAPSEGLRGGAAQAQDDQVTTLHREGPWSEFAKQFVNQCDFEVKTMSAEMVLICQMIGRVVLL